MCEVLKDGYMCNLGLIVLNGAEYECMQQAARCWMPIDYREENTIMGI